MDWRFYEGQFFRGDQPCARLESYTPARDRVEEMEDGVFRITRRLEAEKDRLDVTVLGECVFYEIPCVTYNGNLWGSGVEPQDLTCEGKPWVYASHRSSVPGCTYSETGGTALSLFGVPDGVPFSMSLARCEAGMCHSLLLPQTEEPIRYKAKAKYETAFRPEQKTEGELVLTAYVVLCAAEERGQAIRKTLETAWDIFSHDTQPRLHAKQLWDYGIAFARDHLYFEEKNFRGFCMGLYSENGQWVQHRKQLEIGWVGQNASLAVSLIRDGLNKGDAKEVAQGIGILDCWQQARLSNGLFRVYFNPLLGDWEREERQDAANLFSVVRQYLLAWRLLQANGIDKPAWRATALQLCAFGLTHQLEDGTFPRAWDNEGNPVATDGTAGAYMGWALMEGYREIGDTAMLEAAARCFDAYMARFLQDGYMTAGALDTCCIDKESGIPMLALAVLLYEETGKSSYLKAAEQVSVYLESWMYHYTAAYQPDTLLGVYGYDTLGGTAVSTQHHHIDAYALLFLPFWIRLARHTGNRRWRDKAWALWTNATQFVSDGTLEIDGGVRPLGSQDEGVCQTFWHTSRGDFFHTSRWLVCWNGAFRLENLADEEVGEMIGEYTGGSE